MHKIHSIDKFLAEYSLFTPFKSVENYVRTFDNYTDPYSFHGVAFSFYCKNDNGIKTFELEIPKSSQKFWGDRPGNEIAPELFDKQGNLNYIHHFIGKCKFCKTYHVDFLLHIYSDKPISSNQDNIQKPDPITGDLRHIDELAEEKANIFIEKLGGPSRKIILNPKVEKYLDRTSKSWYYKAKKSIDENFGIGSFAYYRRIIEKELINIVRDISNLNSACDNMKDIIAKYKDSEKQHLIYSEIFQYLPKSLQVLGDNPLKALYQQTSEGLHNLSEEECMQRSKSIETVFEFVIIKLNEEKSELLEAKNAMKLLKS